MGSSIGASVHENTHARQLKGATQLTKPRMRRLATAAALTTSLLVAFAALGGVGVAQSAISAVQYQYAQKVTVCHKGKKSISISQNAVPAHQRHGDTLGTCASAAAKAKKAKAAKAAKVKAAKAKAEKAKAEKAKSDQKHDDSSEKPGNGHGKGGKG